LQADDPICDSLLFFECQRVGVGKVSINYLLIGHVTKDLLPDGDFSIGGTATYSARTALALGCRVGVITSAAADLDLDAVLAGCDIIRVPAKATTTFENIYSASGREQFVHAFAAPLDLDAVPRRWRRPDIVHLAPLVKECDPALADAFPGALVGVTPQGWMRMWNGSGRVVAVDWQDADGLLGRVAATVFSREDVGHDEAKIAYFARLARTLVVTAGADGCRVFTAGEVRHYPATRVPEDDPTGAGDIFAAAFFVRLRQTGDAGSAARFANSIASMSVQRAGWTSTPTKDEVAEFSHSE
jgi:hypothetical protein